MRPWSRRDVLAYLERVEGATAELDHFSLLDVSVDASDDDIQRAFHRVAGGIHPDRHRTSLNFTQHERLMVVYARIAEAYRVLRNAESRDAYLRRLGRQQARALASPDSTNNINMNGNPATPATSQRVAVMLSPKAQRFYGRARAALRTGDQTSAVLNLKMALRLEPTSDLLREALAQAMRKDE